MPAVGELLKGGPASLMGAPSDRTDKVRWHTQMARLPLDKVPRVPLGALGGLSTDRGVRYDGEGGGDKAHRLDQTVTLFGKDPLFPAIGGFSPVRAPVSLFPSHKNLAQPGLLSQINVVLKESGLFDRELGGGFPAGTEQSDPTRQRLDILRVAFAMYTEQAKIYRPFLSVVQREYEGHVRIGESAMAQAAKMQEYLTMGDEHRAEAIEEMKSKWREKLRRAHEAVLESKNLYDKEARAAIELRKQVEELSKRCKEIEDQNEYLTGESIALKDLSHKQQLELDQLKKQKNLDRVEAEILYITGQNKEMTLRVANMKTDLEMQEVRYTKVTQEHKSFKAEIKYLRKQLKDWETVKDSVSPRPEWKRLQQYFPGMSLNAKQRTRHLSERLAFDLRFREARPYLSLFRRMEALPDADSSAKMEIPAQAHQTPQAPVSSSKKRDSIFTWGSTLRKCPHLGLGNLVPCFLRSDKPVTVATVSTNDLVKFMRDFGIVALSGTDVDYNYTVVPEALNMFIGSFGSTAQGAQELGYSLAFALQDMAPHSSDVNLFYHTMMMDLDDSSRFAVVEIRASLQTILASLKYKLRRFLEVVIKTFPWAQQVESELSSIVQPYMDRAPDGLDEKAAKAFLSTKDDPSFAEFFIRFFISHRRRLIQRIFHGLTAAASLPVSDEHISSPDLIRSMARDTFASINPCLSQEDLQHVAEIAVGSEPFPSQVDQNIRARCSGSLTAAAGLNKTGKKKLIAGTKEIWPLSHKLFPSADAADNDEDDVGVMLIMRNIMRIFPEKEAVKLNLILSKMENSFLILDPSAGDVSATIGAEVLVCHGVK